MSEHVSGRSTVRIRDTAAVAKPLKVSLVTSFPPSRGDLNEYGFHLACALRDDPRVDLTILADDMPLPKESPGFAVRRCWRFNSIFNPLRLLIAIRRSNPDIVWFNLGFSTLAHNPVAAFLALMVPALARMMGYYTHVTLHTVFERIKLEDAGLRFPVLYRIAGHIATRLLLFANDVSVLLPSFRSELLSSYGASAQRVQARPHGTFESTPVPSALRIDHPDPIILAFGYWGTYKRLETLLASMDEVCRSVPKATLVIAGTNHPNRPGYLESLQERWTAEHPVRFLGYVPEDELPALFHSASLLVLPYSSAAGTSGVVHQACQYGLPIVATEITEFMEIAREEAVAIEFYPPGDVQALAKQLIRLLNSDDLRRSRSQQNLAAAQGMPMSQVTDQYVRLFHERIPARVR